MALLMPPARLMRVCIERASEERWRYGASAIFHVSAPRYRRLIDILRLALRDAARHARLLSALRSAREELMSATRDMLITIYCAA